MAPLQVQSVHCNPVDANLVMTAGNDYTARVVDIRNLMGGEACDGSLLRESVRLLFSSSC